MEVEIEPDDGEASHLAFASQLDRVLHQIGDMLEASFNNPDIFFVDHDSGFPLRAEVTGEYYISSLTYNGGDESHELWILLYCLGTLGREWDGKEPNFDYVSMEMIVYLDKASGELSYEEHFTSAAI